MNGSLVLSEDYVGVESKNTAEEQECQPRSRSRQKSKNTNQDPDPGRRARMPTKIQIPTEEQECQPRSRSRPSFCRLTYTENTTRIQLQEKFPAHWEEEKEIKRAVTQHFVPRSLLSKWAGNTILYILMVGSRCIGSRTKSSPIKKIIPPTLKLRQYITHASF